MNTIWRRLTHLWTHDWHAHSCESCQRYFLSTIQLGEVLCIECETARMERWIKDFEMRYAQRGAA